MLSFTQEMRLQPKVILSFSPSVQRRINHALKPPWNCAENTSISPLYGIAASENMRATLDCIQFLPITPVMSDNP
jgi:hypothetical protein